MTLVRKYSTWGGVTDATTPAAKEDGRQAELPTFAASILKETISVSHICVLPSVSAP